jgi:hypothetical protein
MTLAGGKDLGQNEDWWLQVQVPHINLHQKFSNSNRQIFTNLKFPQAASDLE